MSPENAAARARELTAQGSRLFESGKHADALDRFQQALALNPADLQAKDWETRALAEVRKVEAFEREIAVIRTAFEDFDFASALKKLYRVEPPGDTERAMVERWTAICWYDWGVLRLQAGQLDEAEEKFQEVLEFHPNDPEVRNHLDVVERYRGRPRDATFQAYVDRLALRPLDGGS